MPTPSDPRAEPARAPVVSDLDEEALLARIVPLLPGGSALQLGPGDDAAVVSAPDARAVVAADVLVEGRHFRRDWSDPQDVGWRAAMQNMADIAAMGARPTALLVSVVAPADLPVAWLEGLAEGLAEACGPLDVAVAGGDLSGGDLVVVAVTVHGDLAGRSPVVRSGARPGDVLAYAGVRGRAAAGVALLQAGRADVDLDLVRSYRRPVCPVAAGAAASAAGATAMLDVSDGLLLDARRIARASGVVLDIGPVPDSFATDLTALDRAAGALGTDPLEWVLAGGEDHGLLATFPADAALPDPFRPIGSVRAAEVPGQGEVLVDGRRPTGAIGWDHFTPPQG